MYLDLWSCGMPLLPVCIRDILKHVQWGTFIMRYPYMICPARDLGTNILSQVTCRPNPVFLWRDFQFSGPAKQILQTMVSGPSTSQEVLRGLFSWVIHHLPSLMHHSSFMSSSWQHLPLSSHRSGASSHPASKGHSTSRISVHPSQVTEE